MTRDELIGRLASLLSERREVDLALLFGSWSRDQQHDRSDVDIAVSGRSIDDLELAAALSESLGREVQVLSLDRDLGVPLLDELIRDGVVLMEGRAGAAASWRTRALITLETDRPWYARMRDAYLHRVAERGL
jgi:predicted nucleotidyltransferase